MNFRKAIQCVLLYGGISKEEYYRVRETVAESNHRILAHWSILVSAFWCYCLLMSLKAEAYTLCRPAYIGALVPCIISFLCSQFLVPRLPQALIVVIDLFKLSILGGAIGIALCQWNTRTITLFAVAIILPLTFLDNLANSILVHLLALVLYIGVGKSIISPEIYSWGLGNYLLFSVFGHLIGYRINKERFERYVFELSAKELADLQTMYAFYDQMTSLKNRRAYSEKIKQLSEEMPPNCSTVMIDLNGLKKMNDTYGHEAGDELIIAFADCIRTVFPNTEEIYRLGGDEFCVILEESGDYMQSRLNALEQAAANKKGRCFSGISISYGMASNLDHADIQSILKEADTRMYESKRRYYLMNNHDRRKR